VEGFAICVRAIVSTRASSLGSSNTAFQAFHAATVASTTACSSGVRGGIVESDGDFVAIDVTAVVAGAVGGDVMSTLSAVDVGGLVTTALVEGVASSSPSHAGARTSNGAINKARHITSGPHEPADSMTRFAKPSACSLRDGDAARHGDDSPRGRPFDADDQCVRAAIE